MTISLSNHRSSNTHPLQRSVKLQASRPVFGFATRVRNHSSIECARPRSELDPKADDRIAQSCRYSKIRTKAAAANDALVGAVYADMVQEIDHYIESSRDAMDEFMRLGPMLEELKEACRAMCNGFSSEEDMKKKSDLVYEKLGALVAYSDMELPEHLQKMNAVWDSLWDSRRETGNIMRRKDQWCGRWCGSEECHDSPEIDHGRKALGLGSRDAAEKKEEEEDNSPGVDHVKKTLELESRDRDAEKEEEMEAVKIRALSLLSQQMQANQLLVQQVKDQQLELNNQKSQIQKLERRVQKMAGEIYDEGEEDLDDDLNEDDDAEDLKYQGLLLSDQDTQKDDDDGRKNRSAKIARAKAERQMRYNVLLEWEAKHKQALKAKAQEAKSGSSRPSV